MSPRKLAPPLRRLPPILDNAPQTPTSSCSKGSRGLSVQPRVLGIFTETAVSPDPSLRQRPSRYAIRAGRNFAFILRFRRRRLSLHPGSVADRTWGRRLITPVDCRPAVRATKVRSHVHKRTISRYGVKHYVCRLPTRSPSRCYDVLERRIRGGLPRY